MAAFPKAFLCDTIGTLVDWRYSLTKGLLEAASHALEARTPISPDPASRRRASELTWTHWEGFAVAWHAKYLQFAASFMKGITEFISCDELQLRSLKVLLKEKGLENLWTEQQQRNVAALWYALDAWPDVANGIACLNSLGSITSTLSNASRQNLRELAEINSIPFTTIISAEDFGSYKPDPLVYQGAIAALSDLDPSKTAVYRPGEVAMLASHLGDLKAAKMQGMQTVYIERPLEEKMTATEIEEMRQSGLIDLWIEDRPYEMGASGIRAAVEILSERYDHHME